MKIIQKLVQYWLFYISTEHPCSIKGQICSPEMKKQRIGNKILHKVLMWPACSHKMMTEKDWLAYKNSRKDILGKEAK